MQCPTILVRLACLMRENQCVYQGLHPVHHRAFSDSQGRTSILPRIVCPLGMFHGIDLQLDLSKPRGQFTLIRQATKCHF